MILADPKAGSHAESREWTRHEGSEWFVHKPPAKQFEKKMSSDF
jgi:hypothetical protein